jgi:hypothetical protein
MKRVVHSRLLVSLLVEICRQSPSKLLGVLAESRLNDLRRQAARRAEVREEQRRFAA